MVILLWLINNNGTQTRLIAILSLLWRKWSEKYHLSYIGLDIKKDGNDLLVSREEYRKDILARFAAYIGIKEPKLNTPCGGTKTKDPNAEAMTRREYNNYLESEGGINIDDDAERKKLYTSAVMSLMYLARHTRGDLVFATSIHASICQKPTKYDWFLVVETLRYLRNTGNYAFRYKARGILPHICRCKSPYPY